MGGSEENRIFVGGLSWDTNERKLEEVFSRFGKVIDAQIMLDRQTQRPRGFGFVTFAEPRAVDDSIAEMHNRELDGRVISVNKAEPKMSTDGTGYGGGGGDSRGGPGGYRGRGDGPPPGNCYECGRAGHWARDCPSAGGGRPGRFSKFSDGGRGDRYADDRYDGGRFGDRDHYDSRDKFPSGRDRFANDRYPPGGDRYPPDRYGGPDRYIPNGSYRERSYERDGPRSGGGYERGGPRGGGGYDRDGPRGGGYDRDGPRGPSDRFGGGGPARYDGGSYRDRPGPYDRPGRGGGRFSGRF